MFDLDNLTEGELKQLMGQIGTKLKEHGVKKKKDNRRILPKVIRPEQARAFLNSFDLSKWHGLRNRTAFQLMYRCGLRISEVCNLSPADVDLQTMFVYVQRGKRNADRYVPVDVETLHLCEQWLNRRMQISPYFVHTEKGRRLSQRYLRRICYETSEKLGIYLQDGGKRRPINPHTFRHCYATERLEEGVSLRVLQQLLGHVDISTTQKYTHVRPHMLKGVVANIKPVGGVAFVPPK